MDVDQHYNIHVYINDNANHASKKIVINNNTNANLNGPRKLLLVDTGHAIVIVYV